MPTIFVTRDGGIELVNELLRTHTFRVRSASVHAPVDSRLSVQLELELAWDHFDPNEAVVIEEDNDPVRNRLVRGTMLKAIIAVLADRADGEILILSQRDLAEAERAQLIIEPQPDQHTIHITRKI